jgi:hypothetical protein
MYMLNLLFDFTKNDGLFVSSPLAPAGAPSLPQSKHWLRYNLGADPANPNPPAFNPEIDANWEDLGPRGTLLMHKAALGQLANIAIRITTLNAPPPAGMTLRLVLSFGHPDIAARTKFASPFTHDGTAPSTAPIAPGTGFVQTAFVGDFVASGGGPNTVNAAGTPAAWFFPVTRIANPTVLNPVAIGPDKANVTDRYEFSLGAIVTDGNGVIRHYGEDPEMDVGQ